MKKLQTYVHAALLVGSVTIGVACGATDHETEPADGHALYLDVHEIGAGKVTAEAVAEAHEADLRVQDRFGVRFLRYWVDEANGKVYCLSEAPSSGAVVATHREAHGLLPASVAEVTAGE